MLSCTKTAISLPDPVFVAAERLADRLRISRSELYAMAVEKFVAEKALEEKDISMTDSINASIAAHGPLHDPILNQRAIEIARQAEW